MTAAHQKSAEKTAPARLELPRVAAALGQPGETAHHEQEPGKEAHRRQKLGRSQRIEDRDESRRGVARDRRAETGAIEGMRKIYALLALGRHGHRRDRAIELARGDLVDHAVEVRLDQDILETHLRGDLREKVDADALPFAARGAHGEGRRLARADAQRLRAERRKRERETQRQTRQEPPPAPEPPRAHAGARAIRAAPARRDAGCGESAIGMLDSPDDIDAGH